MGHSECLRCGRTADDLRGMPRGHYAVNGQALTAGRLQAGYACPICLRNINPRMVLGELRVLCAGPEAHDIVTVGRAIPKAKRDWIIQRQRMDAVEALDGLKGVFEMPILDLQQDAGARLKRAGIIRLGIKVKSERTGKMHPMETPHFVLKDAPGLTDIYGQTPKRLNVYLPFNEVDRNLIAWHQNWVTGGLICRGDGEHIEYAVDPRTGEKIVSGGRALATGTLAGIKMVTGHPVRCPGMAHDYPRCAQCRPNALLIVLIREVPRLAYYQIATASIHNIVNLTGQMRWVKENIGRLQGVPFILERRADKISTPGKNGRVRREKYLLHLEPDPEWVKAMLAEMHQRALPGATQRPAQLEAGDTVTGYTPDVEVTELEDDLLWEPPVESDEETPDPEQEPASLPEAPELTAEIVAQARAVQVRTSRGNVALANVTPDEFHSIRDWLERNGNAGENPDVAQAVAVLSANYKRVAINEADWSEVELPEEVETKLFEDRQHAIGALAHSWTVLPDSGPDDVIAWGRHYRSACDVGDGQGDAVAFADAKMGVASDLETDK